MDETRPLRSVADSDRLALTAVLPTYLRESVLLDTIEQLLAQRPRAAEVIVVDQTPVHEPPVEAQLTAWHDLGEIRWIRREEASQPGALNVALLAATQPLVLFLDDDIRIDPGFLAAHAAGFGDPDVWAVAGQVLQPGEVEDPLWERAPDAAGLEDCAFRFNSGRRTFVENGMSGNLCVRREAALAVGGFDENFRPPVSYRFDNEFCLRLVRSGGRILFEPTARIHHLRAPIGGTRSTGSHLTSASPRHGVGDYYFCLRAARGPARWKRILVRPFREVRTRFHLRHPWWIPVKLIGELRGLLLAVRLHLGGPRLISPERRSPSTS